MTSAVVPGTGMATDFALFGSTHMITLAIVVALSVAVCLVARGDRKRRLAWAIAILLIAQELAKLYVYVGLYGVSWRTSLPLDMCRLNEFLCAYLLVFRSYRAFEVAWFWSMGASVAALVTPDLAQGFPDPRYLLFFMGHGLVVLAALYAVFGYGFQPRLRSVGIALAASAVLRFGYC